MKIVKLALQGLWGLFVDDGSLAIGILVWVFLVALMRHYDPSARAFGVILPVGLLLILLENVRRSARRLKEKQE